MRSSWKRYAALAVLVLSAAMILTIGVGAARIYTSSDPTGMREQFCRAVYDKSYAQLTSIERARIDEVFPPPTMKERDNAFRSWLSDLNQWVIRWIVKPLGVFLIITAALVVSRLILRRV